MATDSSDALETFARDVHALTLARVEAGITDDARDFLRQCARCIASGKPVPEPYAEALALRLNEIAGSDEPWKAKLLKRKQGGKGADEIDWRMHIAREVWLVHTRDKMTIDEAAEVVAQKSRIDAARVQKLPGHARMFRPVTMERAKKLYSELRAVFDGEETESREAKIGRAGELRLDVVTVDVRGTIFALKNTISTMVDQLNRNSGK